MGVFLVKAAYGKTVRAVWAADGGQPERAPPPTLQGLRIVLKDGTPETIDAEGSRGVGSEWGQALPALEEHIEERQCNYN